MPNEDKPTADQLAQMASRGEGVSRLFTNRFTVVAPDRRGEETITPMRDIDRILTRLNSDTPAIEIAQLQVVHPGSDDDGIWFINLGEQPKTVYLESSDGNCPFLIETDFSSERVMADTIDEGLAAVERLCRLN